MDHLTRDLERQAHAGDPEAAVKLLLEQVRVGALSRARLRVAALLGHEMPVVACAESLEDTLPLRDWMYFVGTLSVEVSVRMAVAAAHVDRHGPGPALQAAEALICCPCHAHARALRPHAIPGSRFLQTAGDYAARAVYHSFRDDSADRAARRVWTVADALPVQRVRLAVRTELIPWALGICDPVRERFDVSESWVDGADWA